MFIKKDPTSTNTKKSKIVRIATWSALHPWLAIIGWFVAIILCVVLGAVVVGTRNATAVDYRVGEAGRAESMAADGGMQVHATEYVLISSAHGSFDITKAYAAAADITTRMRALPQVATVASPKLSKNGTALLVEVAMTGSNVGSANRLAPLAAQTTAVQARYSALHIKETGDASISKGVNHQRGKDLQLSEEVTLPVTLIILVFVFGAVFAGVPLVLALTSIAGAVGLAALGSHIFPDAGLSTEVIIMMGLAVGIDYSLFYVKRVREEWQRAGGQLTYAAAVESAAATSGHSVLVSGVAVALSTACLYFANDVIFSSLATGTIVVVLTAVVSSLTILPALLVKLGRFINRPRISFLKRRTPSGNKWQTILRPALHFPVLTFGVVALLLLALAWPAHQLRFGEQGRNTYSEGIPAVETFHELTAAFPEKTAAHLVVIQNNGANTSQLQSSIQDLILRTETAPYFDTRGTTTVDYSPDNRTITVKLPISVDESTPQAQQTLTVLRTQILPATLGHVPGARYAVTGDVTHIVDYLQSQKEQLPLVIGLLLLVTFLVMVLVFKSIAIGLISIVLNLFSAAASFGILVLVFQHAWAQSILGFTATGFIGSRVPLFLFVILFGLSMDYQVFIISRVKEAFARGVSLHEAILEGVSSSAGTVTSGAIIMTSVFVSFIFLHLLEVKQIGFILAVAVLLDAFIVRTLMLPSLMVILGKVLWWPARFKSKP